MTYYKIVSSINKRLVSHVVKRDVTEVEYKPDEWATAPEWLAERGYHPLVFESLEALRKYLRFLTDEEMGDHLTWNTPDQVWEVECEDEALLPYMLNYCGTNHWQEAFKDGQLSLVASLGKTWPKGTRMFKRVKLTKRLF